MPTLTVSCLRPFALRDFITLRPPGEAILLRKPWTRILFVLFGCHVLLLIAVFLFNYTDRTVFFTCLWSVMSSILGPLVMAFWPKGHLKFIGLEKLISFRRPCYKTELTSDLHFLLAKSSMYHNFLRGTAA